MTDPLAAVGTHLPPEDGVTLTGPREYGPGDNTWLRPLVARYLQDIWGVSRLVPDSVGEYRYRVGGAECWVSVHDFMKPATVEVFATAATRVTPSATLLPAINDLNAGDEIATIYWSGGSVMVKYSIFGATVDRDQLRHVCAAVGKTEGPVAGPGLVNSEGVAVVQPAALQVVPRYHNLATGEADRDSAVPGMHRGDGTSGAVDQPEWVVVAPGDHRVPAAKLRSP